MSERTRENLLAYGPGTPDTRPRTADSLGRSRPQTQCLTLKTT
jgi:hypothetical protein